jgi:hypothetical protein
MCIDIFGISETWLKEKDSDNYRTIKGYNCIRNDRKGKRGGGICLYIRDTIRYNLLSLSSPEFEKNLNMFVLNCL